MPGEIFVGKVTIREADRLAGDLAFEVSFDIDIHRAQYSKGDSADHAAEYAVVEKPFFHPTTISKFLGHVSLRLQERVSLERSPRPGFSVSNRAEQP
jgi:hypothetical protein